MAQCFYPGYCHWQCSRRCEELRFVAPALGVFAVLQMWNQDNSLILDFRVRKEEAVWCWRGLSFGWGTAEQTEWREGDRNPEFFSCVRHVIWANPLISGRWLFGPLGCWVSVTDEKKRGWFDWNLRPTSCQKWTILRERAEFWIYFDMVVRLAERHQKDPQAEGPSYRGRAPTLQVDVFCNIRLA